MDGLPYRAQLHFREMENFVSLEDGSEDTHNLGVTHGSSPNSAEKVPEASLLESDSNFLYGVIEIVLPFDEEFVEAQNSWNIGKALGLKVGNEVAMIEALSKVKECQDFSLQRRRGRPKKNKGGI